MEPKHASFFHSPHLKNVSAKSALIPVLVVGLVAGLLGGMVGSSIFTKTQPRQQLSGSLGSVTVEENSAVVDVVEKAAPAVVSIVVSQDIGQYRGFDFDPFGGFYSTPGQPNIQQVGAGTGFFISQDGLIVTNKHVVEETDAQYTVVTNDGKSYEAKVLTRDPVNDLAIMKIEITNAPKLELNTTEPKLGQRVIAIGYSLGEYANTVTTGVVSGIGRSILAGSSSGSEQLEGVIQTDAAINPGNSGGPLLDITGRVIGINTAIDRQGQLVGFAIPASDVEKALASFERTGRIVRPMLGVRYVIVTEMISRNNDLPRDYGALIVSGLGRNEPAVLPGSPADKAGLAEGDIILEVEGKRIDQDNSLVRLLKPYSVGDSVRLKVYSKGNEKNLTVVLTEFAN